MTAGGGVGTDMPSRDGCSLATLSPSSFVGDRMLRLIAVVSITGLPR